MKFYSQIPSSKQERNGNISYIDFIKQISEASESYGFHGSLIYHNHYMCDQWTVANIVLSSTQKLVPLIATQPNQTPPHVLAKKVQTFYALYNRLVELNFITGNNIKELKEIGDIEGHSARYERLEEFIEVIQDIFSTSQEVNYSGKYYEYKNLYQFPIIESLEKPSFFLAGASEEGLRLAEKYADFSLTRPGPAEELQSKYNKYNIPNLAIRIGILARQTKEEAWWEFDRKFKINRIGKIRALSNKKSTIINNKEIAEYALAYDETVSNDSVYSLNSYLSGNNNNPYLVGSYEEVAKYISKYRKYGVNAMLVSDLFSIEEFKHISKVIKHFNTINPTFGGNYHEQNLY